MLKNLIIFIALVSTCHSVVSQTNSSYKEKNAIAEQHIQNLKEGVLLVRLSTAQPQIQALRRVGRHKEAVALKTRMDSINKSIIRSFKTLYTFSDVMFFTSEQTERVQVGFWEGAFVNDSLEVDSSIAPKPGTPLFISYIGYVNSESTGGSFRGLVITDIELQYLDKPFPAVIKGYDDIPGLSRIEAEMIILFNKKLNDFFVRTQRKIARREEVY